MSESGEPFDPYYHWLGIPPDEQPPSHYRLLGIQPLEENREVIQNAADRQMAHLRTFQSGPHSAASQKLLNEVSTARVCLLSTEKKAAYDQQLRAPVGTRRSATPPDPATAHRAAMNDRQNSARSATPEMQSTDSAPLVKRPLKRMSRRRRSRLPFFVASLALLSVVGASIAGYVYFVRGPKLASKHCLVLNWPASERDGATVEIDGHSVDLSVATTVTDQTVELPLEPGRHKYRISRPQSKLLKGQFELKPDERLTLDIVFTPTDETHSPENCELVLNWPAKERKGRVLEIDGKPYDLSEKNVTVADSQVRITLPMGRHRLTLVHNGKKTLERIVELGTAKPETVSLRPTTGTLELRWRRKNRTGYTVKLGDKQVDLGDAKVQDSGSALAWEVPAGRTTLTIQRDGADVATQRVTVLPGKRVAINVDTLLVRSVHRVLLRWPVDQRDGAILEIDGQRHDLPAKAEDDEIAIELEPGAHSIRVTRPGYEVFEGNVVVRRGTTTVRIDARRAVALTLDADELRRLRDEYVKIYTQYDEFRAWSKEADAGKKQRALSRLLNKMSNEAASMKRSSPEQYVAYDQAYRMASEHDELSTADAILGRLRSYLCISEEELNKRQQELWDRAVATAEFDAALTFFRTHTSTARKLTAAEQQTLGKRISESPTVREDYQSLIRIVGTFESTGLLSAAAANQIRAEILLKVYKNAQFDAVGLTGLAEQMLKVAAELLALETDAGLVNADSLVDAANGCRRKILNDRRSPTALRPRVEKLNAKAKELQDQVTQFRRVVAARAAIASNHGTVAQQKIVGLWLLAHSQFAEALPHLRAAGDPTLAAIARPLPDTKQELVALADAIERESKKTKYSRRYEEALLAYADYVRQLAAARKDDLPKKTTKDAVSDDAKMSPEAALNESAWARLPKGNWHNLLDIVTFDELHQAVDKALEGKWTVHANGTIESTEPTTLSRLELPLKIEGSYAIRCVCQQNEGECININLPLGDRSILFTLGAFNGRFSGLAMIDGLNVDNSKNVTSLDIKKFRLQPRVPVQLEVHVELLPAAKQSPKLRKMTGGADWTRIAVMLNGNAIGGLSAATSRFSAPSGFALSAGAIGFSTNAAASYRGIRLMRK